MKALIDKNFIPMYVALKNHEKSVAAEENKPFSLCIERENGYVHRYDMRVHKKDAMRGYEVIERVVKTLIYMVGGFRVYVAGDKTVADKLGEDYRVGGVREFDVLFMQRVYERKFEIVFCEFGDLPDEKRASLSIGGHKNGCRIGFDAGGSTRKVSAVIDGEVVFSEQVPWSPKLNSDPRYHRTEIETAFKSAAAHLPRVDGIGVSGAGIYVDNRAMIASLFVNVSEDDFNKHIKTVFIDAAAAVANVPLVVANDGDVTALAGAAELNADKVLGLALGTSTGGGYVDGGINGWLNELGFVPIAFNRDCVDEWSGDYGTGANYICQEGVIHLAGLMGHKFVSTTSPEKFGEIFRGMTAEPDKYSAVFENMGEYLGYAVAYYAEFYDIRHVLLMGGVTAGAGGAIMIDAARAVLDELGLAINLVLPDGENRSMGLSVEAAFLPEVKNL